MRLLGSVVLSALGPSVVAFVQPPCSTYNFCRLTASSAIRRPQHTRDADSAVVDVASRAATHDLRARTRKRSLVSRRRLCVTRGDTPDALPTTIPHAAAASFRATDDGAAAAVVEPTAAIEQDCPDWSRTTATGTTPTATTTESTSSSLPLALLNAVTVLWGTQHAVIKLILQGDLSPGVTNFARFSIAALLFSPWTPGLLREPPPLPFSPKVEEDLAFIADGVREGDNDRLLGGDSSGVDGGAGAAETWRAGAELGVWMFLGFAFQSIGLGFTTASRSAFLLYLNVKLVPFFAFVLEGRSISIPTWISAFLAFVGTVLLSSDGTPPNVGDLWSVLAAATSAMFILRLEKYSGRCDASQLNSANLWITAGLCGLWAVWEVSTRGVNVGATLEGIRAQAPLIGYLAVVTTALTNWMQALGQRSVPAERAAVIYAMDPVYAAGFAYLLLGESLGPTGLVGAGIVTGAAVWSQGQQNTPRGSGDELDMTRMNSDGDGVA